MPASLFLAKMAQYRNELWQYFVLNCYWLFLWSDKIYHDKNIPTQYRHKTYWTKFTKPKHTRTKYTRQNIYILYIYIYTKYTWRNLPDKTNLTKFTTIKHTKTKYTRSNIPDNMCLDTVVEIITFQNSWPWRTTFAVASFDGKPPNFYLMVIVVFALSLTVYETFNKKAQHRSWHPAKCNML